MSKNVGIAEAINELGSAANLAEALGISAAAVSQMLNLKRPVPARRCVQIEALTNGKVCCESLRSDVDWTYLRHTAKVDPKVVNRKAQN